ncbi:unnamed protein product [Parnassius apollo]|uniref:(apollo) hypothetical protein n=1 Tax=Parnassius apollo TaxID=110799 RepID=A0A8S3XFP5_PARAO|nr:unnamed protein product [Parnassius apollo]
MPSVAPAEESLVAVYGASLEPRRFKISVWRILTTVRPRLRRRISMHFMFDIFHTQTLEIEDKLEELEMHLKEIGISEVRRMGEDIIEKCSLCNKIKAKKQKQKKIRNSTEILTDEREKAIHNTVEYRAKDKIVKRPIRKDIRNYNLNLFTSTLDNSTSLKRAKQGIEVGKSAILSLKDDHGIRHGDRHKILQICTEY